MVPPLATVTPSNKYEQCLDDLCRELYARKEEVEELGGYLSAWEAVQLTNATLREAKTRHPELEKTTGKEVHDRFYYLAKLKHDEELKKKPRMHVPDSTPTNFWKAAYYYNPGDRKPDPHLLLNLMLLGNFTEPIPIGRLYGKHDVALIPQMGALPTEEPTEEALQGTDGYASHVGGGAIIYADGHPSEDDIEMKVSPTEERLRRYCSLGFIVLKESKETPWEKTGHVLVTDLDEGKRGQPWLVLATRWPMEGNEAETHPDDDDPHHVPDVTVYRNYFWAKGVLPGHKKRTPIAKLVPMPRDKQTQPLLQLFSANFAFDLEWKSGPRLYS